MTKQLVNIIRMPILYNILDEIKHLFSFNICSYENPKDFLAKIKGITTLPEVGETYKGKIKTILDFGAFVEILPGKEGLLHISEIDHKRVANVKDELEEGQIVDVKLLEIDKRSGKFKLSRKALMPKPERA